MNTITSSTTLMRAAAALAILIFFLGCAADAPDNQPNTAGLTSLCIVLIGDSTVSNYPETHRNRGWGQYLDEQFTEGTVRVINLARPGRSTKTFIEEDRWRDALARNPDIVFIQFGHNDAHAPQSPESTDPARDYKDNLRQYIEEARAAGAQPLLITPMVRRSFNEQGLIEESLSPPGRPLQAYATAMKEVGRDMSVPVIDLFASSKTLAERIGPEASLQMASRSSDITHFNEKGARAITGLIVADLPHALPELAPLLKPR